MKLVPCLYLAHIQHNKKIRPAKGYVNKKRVEKHWSRVWPSSQTQSWHPFLSNLHIDVLPSTCIFDLRFLAFFSSQPSLCTFSEIVNVQICRAPGSFLSFYCTLLKWASLNVQECFANWENCSEFISDSYRISKAWHLYQGFWEINKPKANLLRRGEKISSHTFVCLLNSFSTSILHFQPTVCFRDLAKLNLPMVVRFLILPQLHQKGSSLQKWSELTQK
jgi:hypothetical protein